MIVDDTVLLQRYVASRDEGAFAELVQRYVSLVYFAALRQVGGDAHRAEEVAQTVFTLLARKASSLVRHRALAGWLHTTTRFSASEARRAELRRVAREQQAHSMQELTTGDVAADNWEQLRPVIDEVLDQLNDDDREAVLLRFFANQSLAVIGAKLEVTENAARMRIDRALGKLEGLLAQRGVTSTAAALTVLLGSQAAATVPVGLAASLTTSAMAGSAVAVGGVAWATTKLFTFMSTTKLVAGVAAAIAVATTTMTWQQRQANAALRAEVGDLRSQVVAQRAENDRAVAGRKAGEDTAAAEHIELLQLRAAREAFRKRLAQTPRASASPAAGSEPSASGDALKPGMVSVGVLQDVGRGTPRAAAQTMMAAAQKGDTELAASCLDFDPAERTKLENFIAAMPAELRAKYGTPETLMASVISGSPKPIAAVQLLGETQPDPDTAVQQVQIQYQSGEVRQDEIKFHRDATGWKQVVSPATVDHVIAYFKGSGNQ